MDTTQKIDNIYNKLLVLEIKGEKVSSKFEAHDFLKELEGNMTELYSLIKVSFLDKQSYEMIYNMLESLSKLGLKFHDTYFPECDKIKQAMKLRLDGSTTPESVIENATPWTKAYENLYNTQNFCLYKIRKDSAFIYNKANYTIESYADAPEKD